MQSLPSAAGTVEEVRKFLAELRADLPDVFRPRRGAAGTSGPEPQTKAPASLPHPAFGHLLPGSAGKKGIPYQGGAIAFRVAQGSPSGVVEDEGGITLVLSEDESTAPSEFLREWYLKKAWQQLTAASQRWSGVTGLTYRNLRVKDQKSLWGSCTRDGDLNFNWRLVLAPPPVLEYLVIHELAHLQEPNHSKRFWAVVASWCPDYPQRKRWLLQNDKALRLDIEGLMAGWQDGK